MRTLYNFLAVIIAIFSFSLQSCKKSDPAPDPTPTVKPDTLTAGWSKQVIPGATNLADVFFNSSTNGYACSDNGLFKSNDGGISWAKLSPVNNQWYNCFVTADGKAFFVTQTSSTIFKTTDGGSSFTNPAVGSIPLDVFFLDNNNGFCIAQDGLYSTVDAGISWQKIATTGLSTGNYASLSFINNTTGWIVSQAGIFRSVGSLANWQASLVNGSPFGAVFGSVYAASASVIYAADFSGEIFKSTDGGANFIFIKQLEEQNFTDLHFVTDQLGYACAGRSIYKTTDGGINWIKVVSLGENAITEIHFTDAGHGWACCSNGIVLTFK
ncbi:MAG: hypothetical protein JNM14_00970 [Ferruginibacter sp.]|nr:hypothetical protein [Ferruginibacter sp.]